MKISQEQIKELENAYSVVIFKRKPQIGDTFKVGDVVFEARKEEFKIVVA